LQGCFNDLIFKHYFSDEASNCVPCFLLRLLVLYFLIEEFLLNFPAFSILRLLHLFELDSELLQFLTEFVVHESLVSLFNVVANDLLGNTSQTFGFPPVLRQAFIDI